MDSQTLKEPDFCLIMPVIERYDSIEDVLSNKGRYVATVSGVSMFPMLRNGRDQILVNPLYGRLKPYDVAVYRTGGKYVVHRVLEVCDGYYVTRGDNCVSREFVPDGDVVGVVKGFWKGDRYIDTADSRYVRYARFWVSINPLVRICHYPRIVASRIRRCIRRAAAHIAMLVT